MKPMSFGTFNVFRKYTLLKFYCFMLILPLNPLPHRPHWCGFSPALLLKVSLAAENTLIWILSRKTIHVSLCVVPGNKSFVTESPVMQILPSQTFMCLLRWFLDMNFLPHRAQIHGLFIWLLEMNPLSHRAQWYGLSPV